MESISIVGARENNLRGINLEIPHHELICVTGVSGSGKSSLVYDVVCREAQRRYLETFSSYARQALGKLQRPRVASITGLMPAIAVQQRTTVQNPRSTVGTLSGLYDLLRLLFARFGRTEGNTDGAELDRSSFSFNDPRGACPRCRGLGVEDQIDPELLVADPTKTLRQGALAITLPNGYTIYSQVTIEVLDQVCKSEGFSVDIPWRDLTEEQRHVVLNGSNKIRVPYGKHTLASRMRWTGIAAKPREEGFYKGILPVMEGILQADRNANILRFARTVQCPACNGTRLNEHARSVRVFGNSIDEFAALCIAELADVAGRWSTRAEMTGGAPVREAILKRCAALCDLGLDYLTLERASSTLSAGEAQRTRLASQVGAGLRGVLYVLDEPSVGLHPRDNSRMLRLLRRLRDAGNTVLVVEHDRQTMLSADRLIDIGPGAGKEGGDLVLNTDSASLTTCEAPRSRTLAMLRRESSKTPVASSSAASDYFELRGIRHNNLRGIDVRFAKGALNVVTGVSGAGKSSLVVDVLAAAARGEMRDSMLRDASGLDEIENVVAVDQAPIGRTPRSNAATYTKVFDSIRKLYAKQPLAVERGWDAGRFSFNVAGGRCETCQGAGVVQLGMHFLGDVEATCPDCSGKRFNDETLEVSFRGKSIVDILQMEVGEALAFFTHEPKVSRVLASMQRLGLDYLPLGQPATTLSGGEAQRIKLAAYLCRQRRGHTLYLLDEPTTGLHDHDVETLIEALTLLVGADGTVVVVEHHEQLIRQAAHVIDLGPEGGNKGGDIVYQGPPAGLLECKESLTGRALGNLDEPLPPEPVARTVLEAPIRLRGVSTHNLKRVDVTIPRNRLTVITGVSGSGKSSLARDTLFAVGQHRFIESFSSYARQRIDKARRPELVEACGLTPSVAIDRASAPHHPRSTVGTVTGLYDNYRLLFSRIGRYADGTRASFLSSDFSFNLGPGACLACHGLGVMHVCDPGALVTDTSRPLDAGAIQGSKTGATFGDPQGRHMAILRAVGKQLDIDYSLPWNELSETAREIALHGTGGKEYQVVWQYERKGRRGEHTFVSQWPGLAWYVEDEYERKHTQRRGKDVRSLMREVQCNSCAGARLRPERLEVSVGGLSIADLTSRTCTAAARWLRALPSLLSEEDRRVAELLIPRIERRLSIMSDLGVGYLSAARSSTTLSGGEARRVRLAAQLCDDLFGITYILDEPTVGLHARDTHRLISVMERLRDQGNTVVVVEHDDEVVGRAEHLIELGPGAGENGGSVVYCGPAEGRPPEASQPIITIERSSRDEWLRVTSACANNLRNVEAQIALGALNVIAGVSGSGKSSLALDVIARSAIARRAVQCESIEGLERLHDAQLIDDSPLRAGPKSTTASYFGVLDVYAALFAALPCSKSAGLSRSHFSYLSPRGECPECRGNGSETVALDLLAEVSVPCEACNATRYRAEVLKPKLSGSSIAQILQLTVEDAALRFSDDSKLNRDLQLLVDVGLGHLHLGQPTSTLSGGEAQRLRLARALAEKAKGPRLYILDEPTTGLHRRDVESLLRLFARLVADGHTLLVVEHHPDVILAANHVLELGPDAADEGGEVVFAGPGDELAATRTATGQMLARHSKRHQRQTNTSAAKPVPRDAAAVSRSRP